MSPNWLTYRWFVLLLVCHANEGIGEVVTRGIEMVSGQFAIPPGYQPRN
jgi:hypothetical protein